MYTPLPSAAKPAQVLFLSRSESSVRMDVKSLRGIGTKAYTHLADAEAAITFLQAGRERAHAIEKLSGKPSFNNVVDLVVCDEYLQDGPASVFLYALSDEEGLRSQPVLVLTGSASSASALRAADVYVLERPYSMSDLERMAHKAMSPMRRLLRRESFEKAAEKRNLPILPKKKTPAGKAADAGDASEKKPLTVSDWYAKGLEHLKDGALPDAEGAFLQVLDKQENHLEAALGLARVHRAGGDTKRAQRYLLKAAASCLRQGDAERAGVIAGQLPERMRTDIYASEAVACLEEGRYRAAAAGFMDAAREGGDKPLHRIVARACLMTARPDESMEKICGAFETLGNTATATTLRRRLLSYKPFAERERGTWLDRFPLIKEAVSVANYTAWAWLQV